MTDLNLDVTLYEGYKVAITDGDKLNITQEMGPKYELNFLNKPFVLGVGTSGGGVISSTTTLNVKITAGQILNAYTAIGYDGLKVPQTVEGFSNYAGVTRYALANGETAEVVRSGLLTDANWTWTPNAPIFISTTSMLTQTVPATGVVRRIGWAFSATQINLDPYPVIELGV